MDYFNHNERKTQRPLKGRPDFVNPDFDTSVTSSHGIIVQEEVADSLKIANEKYGVALDRLAKR